VRDHPVFQRDGHDVHVYVPIPMSLACLGGNVVVPTLTGEVDLKVPTMMIIGSMLIA
jgi:molecular chaperone DnaJ